MTELPWKILFGAVAPEESRVGRALPATQQAPWRALNPIRVTADEKIVQRLYFDFDADAAAEFSRTAAVGSQRMAFVKQRIIEFLQFHGSILYIALAHRHCGRGAVFERAAAPSATDDILADIASSSFRVRPENRVATHVAFVGGGDARRQHRRKRAEDRVEHGRQRQAPAADGRGTPCAEQFSRRQDHLERAERTFIYFVFG